MFTAMREGRQLRHCSALRQTPPRGQDLGRLGGRERSGISRPRRPLAASAPFIDALAVAQQLDRLRGGAGGTARCLARASASARRRSNALMLGNVMAIGPLWGDPKSLLDIRKSLLQHSAAIDHDPQLQGVQEFAEHLRIVVMQA
jgi:hypothetical protein